MEILVRQKVWFRGLGKTDLIYVLVKLVDLCVLKTLKKLGVQIRCV